jgi:transcription initiation factor TFIIIB Brf1 subunit/transcription initiation factor TFIIB
MGKTICKEEDKKKIAKRSRNAEFECKSCGATAEKEKHLCKPKKI